MGDMGITVIFTIIYYLLITNPREVLNAIFWLWAAQGACNVYGDSIPGVQYPN